MKTFQPRYKKNKRDYGYWNRKRKIRPTWNRRNLLLWDDIEWKKSKNQLPRSKSNNWRIKFKIKQDIKSYYGGLSESWFQKINKKNKWNSLQLTSNLERKLDVIIFRSHWAISIYSAQQLIHQGHFMVNGVITRTPSYIVKPGDSIEISWENESREKIKKVIIKKLTKIMKTARLVDRVPHFRGGLPNLRNWLPYWVVIPNNWLVDFQIMTIIYIENPPREKFHLYYPLTATRHFKLS